MPDTAADDADFQLDRGEPRQVDRLARVIIAELDDRRPTLAVGDLGE
jgi:hypothetical protein